VSGADVDIEPARGVDLDEALALYRAVGWTAYVDNPDVLRAALAGSSHVVTARRGGHLVGLARVISDGASICYLQDVLVHPDERRAGIGGALVRAVLEPYTSVRQKVLLTDDEPAQRAFYESLGYSDTQEYADGVLRAFVRFDN
jgi:GNAT superfamily N-acetyltransferase